MRIAFARVHAVSRLIAAFLRTRFLARRLKTRADVEAWQAARIARWLARSVPRVRAYAGQRCRHLAELPIVDKVILMADFAAFNRPALTSADGWRILAGEAPPPPGVVVGASTGTSGNRGLYVVSDAERHEWLGVILAKALPRWPLEAARIALILPLNAALYAPARRTPRLALQFFDLSHGLEAAARGAIAYRPDTLIAPPKVLRWLAEHDRKLAPRHVFSGAEVLDSLDRRIIEARYGRKVREIYMATEGLFGVACALGTLHLAEDVVHVELQRLDLGSDLVSPVITDFSRREQIMARYRMNDLLRLAPAPCACGSPLQAVAEVVGRRDDILLLPAADGRSTVAVTPDVLRNAIVDADRRIDDFRLIQTGPDRLLLHLAETLPDEVAAAAAGAVAARLARLGARAEIASERCVLAPPLAKLRRIERRWRAPGEAPR